MEPHRICHVCCIFSLITYVPTDLWGSLAQCTDVTFQIVSAEHRNHPNALSLHFKLSVQNPGIAPMHCRHTLRLHTGGPGIRQKKLRDEVGVYKTTLILTSPPCLRVTSPSGLSPPRQNASPSGVTPPRGHRSPQGYRPLRVTASRGTSSSSEHHRRE